MPKPTDALDYLAKPAKQPASPVVVLFSDDDFLKRTVLSELKQQVLSGDDAEFSVSNFRGGEVEMRDVADALSTRALFGGGRHLVVVDDADEFVSENRATLEDYVARAKSDSVLVLVVKLWPSTTRLYKALAETGLMIECKFPTPARALKWMASWTQSTYDAKLDPAAAELLLERVEPEMGLVNQELAKLASLAGAGGTITLETVEKAVGGWRAKTTWDMLDAALAGDSAKALAQLNQLLIAGEVPIALLAQIASNLRRLAAATRLVDDAEARGRRISLREALEQAGIKPYFVGKAELQLRHLGRERGRKLYSWLLVADLALKGTSSTPSRGRLVLEELIVKVAASGNSNRQPMAHSVR